MCVLKGDQLLHGHVTSLPGANLHERNEPGGDMLNKAAP
jgi:hypothetical protein